MQTSDGTKYFGELYSCCGGRCIASETWLSQGPHTYQMSRCWECDSCPVLKQKRTNPSCRSLRKSKNTKLSCVIHGGYLWTWGSLWMDNSINILPESYLAEQRIRNLGRVWSAETDRNKIGVCWLDIKKKTHLITIIIKHPWGPSIVGARIPPTATICQFRVLFLGA